MLPKFLKIAKAVEIFVMGGQAKIGKLNNIELFVKDIIVGLCP